MAATYLGWALVFVALVVGIVAVWLDHHIKAEDRMIDDNQPFLPFIHNPQPRKKRAWWKR